MGDVIVKIIGGLLALAAFVGLIVYRTWQDRRAGLAAQQKARSAAPGTSAPARGR
jgi:hypothetical protein